MYSWIDSYSNKELHAPFKIKKDIEYYDDLRKRYTLFINSLRDVSADAESIRIATTCSNKVCEALRDYYRGKVVSCYQKIQNLVKGCSDSKLAVSTLNESSAFPGDQKTEIQFFRARISEKYNKFMPKDMLHHPHRLRAKTMNYRFSIPGVTSLYLANTSYGCWIELGCPSEHDLLFRQLWWTENRRSLISQ